MREMKASSSPLEKRPASMSISSPSLKKTMAGSEETPSVGGEIACLLDVGDGEFGFASMGSGGFKEERLHGAAGAAPAP